MSSAAKDSKVQVGMRNGQGHNGKNGAAKTALVAGGAGFLGSHLCDALLAEGVHVICLDNFLTGRRDNIAHLARDPRFDLIEADVVNPLPARLRTLKLDQIWNL